MSALDEKTLAELFDRLEKPVTNVVYRWLWDREECADVVQDVFLRLWSMRERVRMETVDALVFRMAVNAASNRRRTKRLWGFLGLTGEERSDQHEHAHAHEQHDRDAHALTVAMARETDQRVRAAIDALPEKLRRVVVMTELSGMKSVDVARALGIPEGTVASRRSLAMAKLKDALKDSHHGAADVA